MRHGAFTAILVILAAVSGHGQETVKLGEFKLDDHTFQVETYDECCLKVSYGGQKGYVGVWASGTPEGPYAWWIGDGTPPVTPQGLTCCNVGRTHKDALEGLCRMLVKQHEDLLGRAALDRKSARDQLQEYVESLVERNGP